MLHQFPAEQHRPDSKKHFCNLWKTKLTFTEQFGADLLKTWTTFCFVVSTTSLHTERLVLDFNSKMARVIHFKVHSPNVPLKI